MEVLVYYATGNLWQKFFHLMDTKLSNTFSSQRVEKTTSYTCSQPDEGVGGSNSLVSLLQRRYRPLSREKELKLPKFTQTPREYSQNSQIPGCSSLLPIFTPFRSLPPCSGIPWRFLLVHLGTVSFLSHFFFSSSIPFEDSRLFEEGREGGEESVIFFVSPGDEKERKNFFTSDHEKTLYEPWVD